MLPQPPLQRVKRHFWDVISQLNLADMHVKDRERFAIHNKLINRLDAAIESGQLELDYHTTVKLFETLFPDCYGVGLAEPQPTETPPSSAERVEVYAKRVKNGEAIFDARDACPVREDRKGLKGGLQKNGNRNVAGWHKADDDDEDDD
jgi:hypothetical protein